MKKSIFLLLLLIFYSFTTPKESSIIISGKITNTENGKIRIKGELFDKEIILKPDGTFLENLEIKYNGLYTIETTKNNIPIYLSSESKLTLNADDNNFLSTLKYNGKGSIENQYIINKAIITSKISNEELYKLNEVDFLKKVNEIKNSINTLYNQTKFSDTNFKEKETRNIYYLEQNNLYVYKKFHYLFAGLNEFKVSDKYPQIDDTIDLDNEVDFLFSNDYKEIVLNKFFENVKGDNTSPIITAKNAIPKIKNLKSQSLKNRLIQNAINDINLENANYEHIYNEYISITNDPRLIENLTICYNNVKALAIGNPSPKFDYENQKGGKTSLESLKGKYVYIDVWATWCGPCIKEIPSLQKIEELYKDRNIVFVSISIDNIKNREKWSNMVNEKHFGGIQLLADKESESEFIQKYGIMEIPRFILIDPNGNIVNSKAPKPSESKLIDLFNELKI